MKNYLSTTLVLLVCAAAVNHAADYQSITPVEAGQAHAFIEFLSISPGDQTDPHISGNLVSYTDYSLSNGTVRYYDLLTGIDTPILTDDPADIDGPSSVDGTRIVFSRQGSERTATILFDTVTSTSTELDPQPGSLRYQPAIGGSRVAWVDGNSGSGDVVVYDLDSNNTTNLSTGIGRINGNPHVAPDGNSVVWENCDTSFTQCDVYAASWVPPGLVCPLFPCPGFWQVTRVNETTGGVNVDADTDGTSLVYLSNRLSTSGLDIYFTGAGGVEQRLALPGIQRHPRIDHGVISFETKQSSATPADLFVYVIATNTLYQITSTPSIHESLSEVSVLPDHDIRVVWAANDGPGGAKNLYLATFTPGSVLAVDNVSHVEGDTGTSPFTFTVSLLPARAQTVTVDYATADGTDAVSNGDYAGTSGTLTFVPGETSKTIMVYVYGDTSVEGDETFTLMLSNPRNATIAVNHGIATGTIQNDDVGDTIAPDTMITARPPDPAGSTGTFEFTSTELGSTFECQLDAGVFAGCASPQSYNGLANGNHTFQVRATDAAGNVDQSAASYTWTVAMSGYSVCLLYDPSVARKAGTTYVIKLRLCDASGGNLSSASIPVHASGVTRISNTAPGPFDDTGNANPDFDFRYDATIQGYVFNLSIKCQAGLCFSTGTYTLNFTAGLDKTLHSAGFAVK